MNILHYRHTRNRKEPYPSRNWRMRLLDRIVYAAGILGPISTIPQVLKIYLSHDAAGVSVATWLIYALFDIPWIVYAYVHKEKPLLVCYILWFFFNTTVTIGAIIYGSDGFWGL